MIAGLAVIAIAASALALTPRSQDSHGTYFRLKVALTYQQQPVGFDIVVGCNVRTGRVPGGGSSVETMGMSAFVFAKVIPDEHAISVRSVPLPDDHSGNPCFGATTANGEVKADWMPVVVWYDKAADLSHGYAYVAREAYEGPASQLTFGGAIVEAATHADYLRFLETGPQNLLPRHMSNNLSGQDQPELQENDVTPEMKANPGSAGRLTGWLRCRGIERWAIPPELVETVRKRRPKNGDKFWSLPIDSVNDVIISRFREASRNRSSIVDQPYRPNDNIPSIFPARRDNGLSQLTENTLANGQYTETTSSADLSERRGLIFCDRETPPALLKAITGRQYKFSGGYNMTICKIDGNVVSSSYECSGSKYISFEEDAFLFMSRQIFMD